MVDSRHRAITLFTGPGQHQGARLQTVGTHCPLLEGPVEDMSRSDGMETLWGDLSEASGWRGSRPTFTRIPGGGKEPGREGLPSFDRKADRERFLGWLKAGLKTRKAPFHFRGLHLPRLLPHRLEIFGRVQT